MKDIQIGKVLLGDDHPCLIVAEISGNHGGKIENAIELIHEAKKAGADAVKLQTYKGNTITLNCKRKDFLIPKDSPWASYGNLYDLYNHAHTPWEWHSRLFHEAKKVGLEIFSSPFDLTAVQFLQELNVPAFKIASPEINDLPLIENVAKTGIPIIISSGLATYNDLLNAISTIKNSGCADIIILKCTTAYPAPENETNLMTMVDMKRTFGCLTGLSDHTHGIGIPVAAVALGANMIEKHIALENNNKAIDSFFSLNPKQFKSMVHEIRRAESAIGTINYDITKSAKKNINGKRSIYISSDIKKGQIITRNNVKSVRPGYSLDPKYYYSILGKKALKDLKFGDRITLDDFS